ncbi:MBOAT family O-acyltransferase [Ulvibacter antarcticus]|uniref:D-alanyl-lipoteichoic acid acyltransferase DltB (MBOAT superfamily) n=1 Tax=Ulvibacter antarcticus TaxID=442714 RepID=A0A3L9YLW4_9FLAO|nr:MBOAT family O-acyltransferase [Ulvibacter antarcticus]RMA59008.1 D-alanyl-lipoteichoic acid acyltransferase DltB (MBOAT superfamily) [Ulvibacter antarcticus]
MLFNSFDFGVFLIIVYLLYWSVGVSRRTAQNVILLIASYVFYGLWDWRFLSLIVASSLIDFSAAKAIFNSNNGHKRKLFLWISILFNLGVLIVFKYYNFFVDSFTELFSLPSSSEGFMIWDVIIPVGLSFYTFQTMSYTIDVYRKRIKATNNLVEFLCFVSFFPQLVAGPIERAGKLLPQFQKVRKFDVQNSKEGLRQILWGLFKKMLVADNVAVVVNAIYASPEDYGSLSLLYASALFFFQIYCDFSGYSDIAIGTAKLFGFRLSKNFNIPYLSRTVSEFWQRWHITLTKWFTDYVYGPLIKNSKRNYLIKTLALFVTMTLIGLWHGANWTFVAFGVFQAVTISIERIPIRYGNRQFSLITYLSKIPLSLTIIYSFTLIMTSCIFFRSDSIGTAIAIIKRILSFIPSENFSFVIGMKILIIPILIITEVSTRFKAYPLEGLEKKIARPLRWLLYYTIIFALIRYAGPKEQFIYFQF